MPLFFTKSYYPERVRVVFPEGDEIRNIDFESYSKAEEYIHSRADSSLARFYIQRRIGMKPSILRDRVTDKRAGYIEWIV